MRVDVYKLVNGQDVLAATLTLQGGEIVASPESQLTRNILAGRVRDNDSGEALWARSDPERFMRNLHFSLNSAYLRASPPIEDRNGVPAEAPPRR